MTGGPRMLITTEINEERVAALKARFAPLAAQHGREFHVINPMNAGEPLRERVMHLSQGEGADDVVVCVPSARLMAEAASLMNPDGMLVLFAGVPNGTMAPLDLSEVYLHNAQYTGTSGLSTADQAAVLDKTSEGTLSPGRMVAAIGGMRAVLDAVDGVIHSKYPGKIVIFPQLHNLPLTGLDELAEKMPDIAGKLGPGNVWTVEAEAALIEKFWEPNA
jgi:threonine dehydrogenase-like Zn-dependent dehydrogenase